MAGEHPADLIRVEVVYGTLEKQRLISLQATRGCTVADAIDRSGIRDDFPEIAQEPGAVGIFGQKVALDQPLEEGDRVEIYRPLLADPKESRRQRARENASGRK